MNRDVDKRKVDAPDEQQAIFAHKLRSALRLMVGFWNI